MYPKLNIMYKLKENQYIPYRSKMLPSGLPACKTYWYITDDKGKTIDKTTFKPYRGKEMNRYAFHDKAIAESIVNQLNKKICQH